MRNSGTRRLRMMLCDESQKYTEGTVHRPAEVSAKFQAVIDTEIDSAAPQECHVGLLFSLT